jgi:hypothetical protein
MLQVQQRNIHCLFGLLSPLTLVAAELVLQDLAEQEKSDTAKHSLGEKVSWYSTSNNVAQDDRFTLVFFHGRERAEDKYKESN